VRSGPDPLGKQALFWSPVRPGSGVGGGTGGAESGSATGSDPAAVSPGPAGKHALFSAGSPSGEEATAGGTAEPAPGKGLFVVSCSSCGSVTRIGLIELLRCQLPVAAWLPRRTFDRWMTCPACRRRTWAGVTITG
jgi:hypothetical protein